MTMNGTAKARTCESRTDINSKKRKSSSLPMETVEYLKAWMMSPKHIEHPYPTEQEKAQIMADTGIELKQLTNWFVNNRKRYWKPRVEAKLQHLSKPNVLQIAPARSPLSFTTEHGRDLFSKMYYKRTGSTKNVTILPTLTPHIKKDFSLSKLILSNPLSIALQNDLEQDLSKIQDSRHDFDQVKGFANVCSTSSVVVPNVVTPNRRNSSSSLPRISCIHVCSDLSPVQQLVEQHGQFTENNDNVETTGSMVTVSENDDSIVDFSSSSMEDDSLTMTLSRSSSRNCSSSNIEKDANMGREKIRMVNGQPKCNMESLVDDVLVAEKEGYNAGDDVMTHQHDDNELAYSFVHDNKRGSLVSDAEDSSKLSNRSFLDQSFASSPITTPFQDNDSRHSTCLLLSRTRSVSQEDDEEEENNEGYTPRLKYRRVSLDLWKIACQAAGDAFNDHSLPTLDEAVHLFGYAD